MIIDDAMDLTAFPIIQLNVEIKDKFKINQFLMK